MQESAQERGVETGLEWAQEADWEVQATEKAASTTRPEVGGFAVRDAAQAEARPLAEAQEAQAQGLAEAQGQVLEAQEEDAAVHADLGRAPSQQAAQEARSPVQNRLQEGREGRH